MIDVVDTELGFDAIYSKEYMPKEYEEEIRSANILLIPNENFRDKQGLFFPECTDEFVEVSLHGENNYTESARYVITSMRTCSRGFRNMMRGLT